MLALFAAPSVAVLGLDAARRGPRLARFEGDDLGFYVLSAGLVAAVWVALGVAAGRPRGRSRHVAHGALVVVALLAVAGQLYTYDRYQAYLNHRAVLVGTSMLPSVGQQLWFDRLTVARIAVPIVLGAFFLPLALRRLAPTQRRQAALAADVGAVALLFLLFTSPSRGAEQGQPPDAMYLSSMGQLARARWDHNETVDRVHPGPRTPLPVPPLAPRPARPRNLVLVLTESVRAQSVCVEHKPAGECPVTPFSNAARPARLPLRQMRAVDSTTAISLAVLWAGLPPGEPRATYHEAPLLWEYAAAAGLDTAYWTSQHLLFGNSGTWLAGTPYRLHVSATGLEDDADYDVGADDGAVVDHALARMGELREPFVAVVHLSNTHFPYKVDPDRAPFQPQEEATGPGYEKEILNRYHDAIYLQDVALGRLLDGLAKRPEAGRTVVVYTSDHGEQMREQGAVGHTGTLYDPEVRVPFWIDAPADALAPEERAHLEALRDAPVLTLDVFPTLLDVMGLWDAPGLAPFRAKMPGESLLRGGSPRDRAVALSNCTELWACAFKNWGAMQGTRKVLATQADHAWRCFDLAEDPEERNDRGADACPDLVRLAEQAGGGRPF